MSFARTDTAAHWECNVTDQETIVIMLTAANIPFELFPAGSGRYTGPEAMISITVDEDEHGKVRGYANFISCFYFDANGKLITMGAWK